MELKGTRRLFLAWLPIIVAATVLGGMAGITIYAVIIFFGLQLSFIEYFISSLAGALSLIFILKKYHIPVRGLKE